MIDLEDQETFDPIHSNLSPQDKELIEETRSLGFFDRLFRPLHTGSMRGVILMWIRMTLGIGILTLPKYVMGYGAITGVFLIIVSALINYWAYVLIFNATFYTGKKSYPLLIKELLGNNIYRIFRITYMLDVCSTVMIYTIVSWNLFEYCLYFFGMYKQEWILVPETLQYDESNTQVILIRIIFFLSIFIITIPLFLKKSMDSLQPVTIMYLAILFILIMWILSELPFFAEHFKEEHIDVEMELFKKPQFDWGENIFGLLIGFYVQPFIFSLRGELLLPTLRRTKKVAKLSVLYECILFSILGFCGYFVFGDKYTPSLFILRAPYKGKNWLSEKIFQFIICIFLILNTFGLAMYNTSIRDYISQFYDFSQSRMRYVIVSLIPFALICLCSTIYPQITNTLNFFGYTVFNFNGYIIPFLMGIATAKRMPKAYTGIIVYLYYLFLIFFICLGIYCIGYEIACLF